ncbi:MAG: transposase [Sphingomonas bacterium]
MSGALTGITRSAVPSFAEVQISEPAVMLPAPSSAAPSSGQIGIELPSGVRLTVDASVDAEALSRVIGVLAR